VLDPLGRVQAINDEGAAWLGWTRGDIVGRDWVSLAIPADGFPHDGQAAMRAALGRVVRGDAPEGERLITAVATPACQARSVQWLVRAVTNGGSSAAQVLCVGRPAEGPESGAWTGPGSVAGARADPVFGPESMAPPAIVDQGVRMLPAGLVAPVVPITTVNPDISGDPGDSARRLEDFLQDATDWLWETGPDLRLSYLSPRFGDDGVMDPGRMLGLALDHLAGERALASGGRAALEDLRALKAFQALVLTLDHGHGEQVVQLSGRPRFADSRFLGYRGAGRTITDRVREEQERHKLYQAVEQSPASVIITDAECRIEYVNRKFIEVTGFTAQEVIGDTPRVLRSGHNPPAVYEEMWRCLRAGREWRGELVNKRKDGGYFWEFASISPIRAKNGVVTHYLAVKEDITDRKIYEERLFHQAHFDGLTNLPNRLLALDRLAQILSRGRRAGSITAVMFVDLDQFKLVNDTLGHALGDLLLIDAAYRLTSSVRAADTVARLGGDEFMVIVPDLDHGTAASAVAERIIEAFSRPFELGGEEVVVTASIGIAVGPDNGADPETLLRNADAAMYWAKNGGRNAFCYFTAEMNQQAADQLALGSRLRSAIARQEFFLVYQPVLDAGAGQLTGAEALLRWANPELGLVEPNRFIPLAEETGLINEIGEWVLNAACRDAVVWQNLLDDQGGGRGDDCHGSGSRPLVVSVNVSSRQFRAPNLLEIINGALERSGLPPTCLELEITERLLIEDAPGTIATMEHMMAMGIRISMDDFGTGYSSLGNLKRYPLRTLKIDRSLVREIAVDPADAAIARAIIALGHSLGLRVTGEGIETQAQLDFLAAQNCDLVQGFFLSRPLPQAQFLEFIRSRNRVTQEASRHGAGVGLGASAQADAESLKPALGFKVTFSDIADAEEVAK